MSFKLPSISVVIPTLNSESVLEDCLKSIHIQKYPKNYIEIIVVDGGSTDSTLNIAKKYNAKVFSNPLKTGEAAKAIGVKAAKKDLIALIDSDNILPTKNWFNKMVEPFVDNNIIGSEPIKYTYRKKGGFIERYSALLGMNDPMILFYGNYDRYNYLTEKWTGLPIKQEDKGTWLDITLTAGGEVPTIGANGTIFRRSFLQANNYGDYLFDIDILVSELQKRNKIHFAKVKVGIIHTFCESSTLKFYRKQKRRVMDYFYYKNNNLRSVNWESDASKKVSIIKFITYTALFIPALVDAIKGYYKKRDITWFFHPIACLITLYAYSTGIIFNKLYGNKELTRVGWKQ